MIMARVKHRVVIENWLECEGCGRREVIGIPLVSSFPRFPPGSRYASVKSNPEERGSTKSVRPLHETRSLLFRVTHDSDLQLGT